MWNAPKQEIPESQIAAEHWRVLTKSVADACEYSLEGTGEVHAALDYFGRKVIRPGGINMLRAGLKENRTDKLVEGLALLKKHLGYE